MTTSGVTTAHALLEATIDRALKPDASLRQHIKALGYDMERPVSRYPGTVSRACFEFAAKMLAPGKAPADAERMMGRAVVLAYLDTLVGRVLRPLLERVGPRRALPRVPAIFKGGFTGVECSIEEIEPGSWRFISRGIPVPTQGMVGALQAGLGVVGAKDPRVEVERDISGVQTYRLLFDVAG